MTSTYRFAPSNATPIKEKNHWDHHLQNGFLSFVMEIFSYLHKQANGFLCRLVPKKVWDFKCPKDSSS
jgi:hypothetical protein